MLMTSLQDDISDIELKQRWRLYWLQTIFEFANINLQKMAWIQKENSDWPDKEAWESSFYECTSAYFDILALNDAYEKAVLWKNISKQEAEHAKKFHQLLVFYMEPSSDASDILADQEWLEVVNAAKEFWLYLRKYITAKRELELINELENKYPF